MTTDDRWPWIYPVRDRQGRPRQVRIAAENGRVVVDCPPGWTVDPDTAAEGIDLGLRASAEQARAQRRRES